MSGLSRAANLGNFPDNTAYANTAASQRAFIESALGLHAQLKCTGGATPQAVGTTPVKLTCWTHGEISADCTASTVDARHTVGVAGNWLALVQLSVEAATAGVLFSFELYVNGAPSGLLAKLRVNADGDEFSVSWPGLMTLNAADELEVWVVADAPGSTLTVTDGQFVPKMVG